MKDKIIGVTGDGAFAKGNKPFKQTFIKLLDKDVPIRWDLLHLINRAHKDARGKAIYDQEIQIDLSELADDEELADNVNADHTQSCKASVSELIDFIQSEAKKYRTGIKYTHLKLISGGYLSVLKYGQTLEW